MLLWTPTETIFILATAIIEFLDNEIKSTMNEIPEIHKMLTQMYVFVVLKGRTISVC